MLWISPIFVCLPALEEVMEHFAELMQRLLEFQSGGRQRSAALIAEDKRLLHGLQERILAEKPTQDLKLKPYSPTCHPKRSAVGAGIQRESSLRRDLFIEMMKRHGNPMGSHVPAERAL